MFVFGIRHLLVLGVIFFDCWYCVLLLSCVVCLFNVVYIRAFLYGDICIGYAKKPRYELVLT